MQESIACLHSFVEGRVQGVGFRFFVQEQAQRLQLTGWVRNIGEDQVEVWAEGPQPELDQLLDELRRGPSSAYVSNVRIEPETPKGNLRSFQVAPSDWF
jgi:acylphosphatase